MNFDSVFAREVGKLAAVCGTQSVTYTDDTPQTVALSAGVEPIGSRREFDDNSQRLVNVESIRVTYLRTALPAPAHDGRLTVGVTVYRIVSVEDDRVAAITLTAELRTGIGLGAVRK